MTWEQPPPLKSERKDKWQFLKKAPQQSEGLNWLIPGLWADETEGKTVLLSQDTCSDPFQCPSQQGAATAAAAGPRPGGHLRPRLTRLPSAGPEEVMEGAKLLGGSHWISWAPPNPLEAQVLSLPLS